MDVTKPYEFIGFGAMDVTKPYEFTWFGAMDVTKPQGLECSALAVVRTPLCSLGSWLRAAVADRPMRPLNGDETGC